MIWLYDFSYIDITYKSIQTIQQIRILIYYNNNINLKHHLKSLIGHYYDFTFEELQAYKLIKIKAQIS